MRSRQPNCSDFFEVVSSVLTASSAPKFRRGPRDFSRGGVLSPELLVTLLLYMIADAGRRGYRHLLPAFWDEARSFDLPLPTRDPVSAPSFCAARHKITSEQLHHILREVATTSLDTAFGAARRWHGRRVFGVDGTWLNLQRGDELARAFGVPEGAHCPQAMMSVLLDVCAKAPVDLRVAPFASSERDHLLAMLPSLQPGDIVVLDRGYPSHEVLQELVGAKVDFLIRVPATHTFGLIDDLRESRGNEYLYWLDPPQGSPPDWKRLKLRAVRLRGPSGETSYFITTLWRESFSRAELRKLYRMRWEAEEHFKLMKGPYIGQGQFRSKTAAGVEQEIHALNLFLLIARVLMATVSKDTGAEPSTLSKKAAVLGLAAYVTRLFLCADSERAERELRALLERVSRTREKQRRRRSFPRVSYRPRLRWGPSGRCGG